MKVNDQELRVGNYVNEPTGHLHRVERTSEDTKRTRYPVPLTNKWFDKTHAGKTGKSNPITTVQYHLDRFVFTYFPSYKYWYVADRETGTYLTKIEFVHELQNFYKIMQGQELKFNKPI